jgi:hypothetical protein
MFPSAREEDEFKEDRLLDPESATGSVLAGAGQGATLGYRDELNALLASMARNKAKNPEFWDKYRQERDANRDDDKAAHKAHPKLYNTAEFATAMAAPLPIPKVATGASLLSKGGKYALAAAPVGAAFGLGASDSDLTKPNDIASGSQDESNIARATADTLIGAGAGGLFAGAIPFAGAGARAAAPKVAKGLQSGASGVSKWLKFMNAGNAPDELVSAIPEVAAKEAPAGAELANPKLFTGEAQKRAAENLVKRKAALADEQMRLAMEKKRPKGIELPVDPEVAKQAALITKMKKMGVYEPEGVPSALKGKLELEELPIDDAWTRKDLVDKLPALRKDWANKGKLFRDRGPGYQERSPSDLSPEPKMDPPLAEPQEIQWKSMMSEPKHVPLENLNKVAGNPHAKGGWTGRETSLNALGRSIEQANQSKIKADPRFMLDNGPKLADLTKKGTSWVQSLSAEEASAVQKAEKLGVKALGAREVGYFLSALEKNKKAFKGE